MAEIKAFRGIRYNPALAGDLAAVITPPYDVIPSEMQERYHERSPYSVIRLELGETFPGDNEENNRYTRARDYLNRWLAEGILISDENPAFYVCQDEFTFAKEVFRRTGLIVALKTTPYHEGIVLPHEDTLPKAKADRLALMEACKSNFSSIFALYQDQEGRVTNIVNSSMKASYLAKVVDDEGVCHRLWRIDDPKTVQALEQAFAGKKIYIADGHHRYETACKFAEEHGPEYGYIMTTLFDMNDPGLVVLPTHRLVRNVGPIPWESLSAQFDRQTLTYPELLESPAPLDGFLDYLARRGKETTALGIYAGGTNLEILALRDRNPLSMADRPEAVKQLDVTILHELVLKPAFGLGSEEIASEGFVAYTRDPEEAWRRVTQGEAQFAVFQNPPTLEQITAVAAEGGRMPQKSTFVWPKLITGLVLHRLGD